MNRPPPRRSNHSYRSLALLVFFSICVFSENSLASIENTTVSSNSGRPIIHTFFHKIEPTIRFTGMTDNEDDDLLSFWRESWYQAGWDPIVLSLHDAQRHPEYRTLQSKLDTLQLDAFNKLLFTRWLAMGSAGGGWYVDYDVFPLHDDMPRELPNNGTMTVYDILSPTLASGSGDQWMLTLEALLEDAIATQVSNHPPHGTTTFWTDSLGILNLVTKFDRKPPCPSTDKRVALPYGKKDPLLSSSGCDSREFRGRWVVHFGQEMMQAALYVPSELRLPNGRLTLAREWLPGWRAKCYHSTVQNEEAISA
jgi:hypothetical protein